MHSRNVWCSAQSAVPHFAQRSARPHIAGHGSESSSSPEHTWSPSRTPSGAMSARSAAMTSSQAARQESLAPSLSEVSSKCMGGPQSKPWTLSSSMRPRCAARARATPLAVSAPCTIAALNAVRACGCCSTAVRPLFVSCRAPLTSRLASRPRERATSALSRSSVRCSAPAVSGSSFRHTQRRGSAAASRHAGATHAAAHSEGTSPVRRASTRARTSAGSALQPRGAAARRFSIRQPAEGQPASASRLRSVRRHARCGAVTGEGGA